MRDYYDSLQTTRIKISYAIQEEPLGTANAVLAAKEWVGTDRFVMVNGDNYYPTEAVRALGATKGNATIGFDADGLVQNSNIPAERIAAFAILRADANGDFADIIEKPAPEVVAAQPKPILVSMNCFCFTPEIFAAAERIVPSARGEYEIVDAVRDLVEHGQRVEIVRSEAGVLDMSNQNDIKAVEQVLQAREVVL
ncbi:sugar phosphate nucleotidyltransferase [Arcanobacterium hippocoleae]|uniref:sugar phosphate nucleotidyltransferase n=1 Tax=Arcanobacterium hippocoleae TaxID=149017 RepID=UPI00334178BC